MKQYEVSLFVNVTDEDAVIRFARMHAKANGYECEPPELDVETALRYIFDPGSSPCKAVEIADSACARLAP